MAKDWNYWKKKYLEDAITEAENKIWAADQHESPIEKIASLMLYGLYEDFPIGECRIHPQVILGKYIIDFLITYEIPGSDKEYGIVIECDGHDFHEKTKEQVAKGKERDRFLTKEGYVILRYSGSEICEDPTRIVMDVKHLIYKYRGWV